MQVGIPRVYRIFIGEVKVGNVQDVTERKVFHSGQIVLDEQPTNTNCI
jgi:hypothetical protein